MKNKFLLLSLGCMISSYVSGQSVYEEKIPGTAIVFKMVLIPAGENMAAFWMGATEVTFDAYDIYADAEKDKTPIPDGMTRPSPPYIDLTLGMGKLGGYPANSMSQYGALMYCRWLYAKTGIFYRLPTEAEWEYACRAGSTTGYPFGEDTAKLKLYAWYAGESENKYHKVGEKLPNAWGLYDMLGNVAEWTLDLYDPSPPEQVTAKTPRTLKGGCYQDDATRLRSDSRLKSDPIWNRRDPQIPKSNWWFPEAPFIGIRLVRPAKTPTKAEIDAYFNKAPIADY